VENYLMGIFDKNKETVFVSGEGDEMVFYGDIIVLRLRTLISIESLSLLI